MSSSYSDAVCSSVCLTNALPVPHALTVRTHVLHRFYGVVVFIVEMIGATTVVLYGINLIWEPAIEVEDVSHFSPHAFMS